MKSAPLLLVGRYELPAEQRHLSFPDRILPDMAEEAYRPWCRKIPESSPVPEASIKQTYVQPDQNIYLLRTLVSSHESGP